jgi:hypothetical protein
MYNYKDFEDKFGDEGSLSYLLAIYKKMLRKADYVTQNCLTTEEIIHGIGGDSWMMLAAIDKLEEMRCIRCTYNQGSRNYWRYVVCQ